MRRWVSMVAALLGVAVVVAACGSSLEPVELARDPAKPASLTIELTPQSVTAAGVEVGVEPLFLDEQGAGFEVTFDTHEGDLAMDVAASSQLEVGGITWDGATWSGDPPGGHHRGGELRFAARGPITGQVVLRIGGLPDSVEMLWDPEEG